MPASEYGSLTKEFPLASVEQTIKVIFPGMRYPELLSFAARNTRRDIPGLLRKRFLLVEPSGRIVYDEFLSLVQREGVESAVVRKAMLFVWAYRDDRIRRFIVERIANQNGKWNASKVINKANANFFDKFGGAKARSNFEYFLVETGIFDPHRRVTHLELEDGWLEDAARVAAQHESNPETRRLLLDNPYEFLVAQELTALSNSTASELLPLAPRANYDAGPRDDEVIIASPTRLSAARPWSRKKPTSGDKAETSALINLVVRERANQSHYAIEAALAAKIRAKGYKPQNNDNIDMFFSCDLGSVIFEVKSCTENNVHSQPRKGISQLLEYHYLYARELTAPVHLALAIEAEPGPRTSWLKAYLKSLNISIAWLDRSRLITSEEVPAILGGIFEGT